MSEKIVRLTSTSIVRATDRVREFIDLARDHLNVLIASNQWSEDIWAVGASFITKGQNRDNRILAFYNVDATISNKQQVVGEPLDPTIVDFAKAYLRYMHSASPVSFENTQKRLDAIRFIEASFRKLGLLPVIEKLNVVVLNQAVEMARAGVGPGRHYQFAIYIQQIHRFCLERNYLDAPFQWKHGVRKPTDRTAELGAIAKEWREDRLPSPEAYHALAHVFRNAETFIDRLYSAVAAICISIPIRAHEVLQLRLDCEVNETSKNPDTGEIAETYGIRVWPGKGNPPQVKWVPTQMVIVVKKAIDRLRDLCGDARSVAAWYEKHPGELWLPDEYLSSRLTDWLTFDGVQLIVGAASKYTLRYWLEREGVEFSDRSVRITSLAAKLLPLLPRDFPNFNGEEQPYSKSLVLLFHNQGHAQRGTYRSIVTKATVGGFEHWLSGHDGGKKPSVFKVWRFTERDGTEIEITTHAFRHWLNTVAQLKGMSELDIAKWSGRDVSQNKAYNHVTPDEILSQIKEALDDGNAIGPMFEESRVKGVNQPVDRREFIDAQVGAALVTDYGICVHDYSLLPCQAHGNCVGCSENVFVKGDVKHIDKVTKRLALTGRQLQEALLAMGEGYHGADRWVQSHERSVDRMRQMLAIHNDLSIPGGTIVSLPDASTDNEVAMAIRDREGRFGAQRDVAEPPADAEEMRDALADMWEE